MTEPSTAHMQATGRSSSGRRMVAGLRLALAVLALAITYIDPTEPSRLQALTYAVLVAYVAGSAVVYAANRGLLPFLGQLGKGHYWADVAFSIALIALSGGSNSIYFVLFFFAILAAAFRDGFRGGIRATLVCAGLFVIISIVQKPLDPDFDLNRFLIRSSMLPIIGYLISFWGGREVQQRRQLAFLNELGLLANPRLDVDRILALVMDRLRTFFSADSCVAITCSDAGESLLRRVDSSCDHKAPLRAEPAPKAIAAALLALDCESPVVCGARRLLAHNPELIVVGQPRRAVDAGGDDSDRCRAVADLLEAQSFISAPLRLAPADGGRLYLARGKGEFTVRDAQFLGLAIEQFEPTLQYVALIDRMAGQVIEDERQRIALDIHDQVIQPYIGLQFGLTALTQLLENPATDEPLAVARERARKLLALSSDGIADLRQYVSRLKEGSSEGAVNPSTLAAFADRFSRATGIDVELHLADGLAKNDAVAQTAFPIVAEALSNVRRHTMASRAVVDLGLDNGWLRINIENPVDLEAKPEVFVPKSITERVAAIGGSVRVDPHSHGCTRVTVDIPV
jgi:signal transduction histidine kinase